MSEKNNDFEIPDDLYVVQLEGENVKRLYAAAISPTDEVTKIGGWNENGKSSLVDCVSYTLCGGRALPAEPLRRGAKKGRSAIEIASRSTDFGLKAERRYTKKGDILAVLLNGQDAPTKAPQELLNRLYNANAAQPDEFLDLPTKDKLKSLQRIVGINFDDLNEESAKLYVERTGVTREAKLLEAQVAGTERYDDAPKEATNTVDLVAQIKEASNHNEAIAQREQAIKDRAEKSQRLLNRIAEHEEEIEKLRAAAVERKQKQSVLKTEITRLAGIGTHVLLTKETCPCNKSSDEPCNVCDGELAICAACGLAEVELSDPLCDAEPVNAKNLVAQLAEAEETNRKVLANTQRRELEKQMRAKNSEVTKLTLALERIVEEKEKRLSEAKFPVPGLSFSDDGVLLHGIPLEQASQEQQVVTAAAIALAQQPKLRAILMRRGALLDPKHQAALRVWAKENKCQVFLEVVGKDADCEVIIEDGMVEKGAIETNGE